ncbi:MAG: hypothetical protein IJU14_04715 [Clostridia bacterium]|nr:hypothetical protein [Clostridia bacterium]
MVDLIRMDFYRMFKSKSFIISNIVVFVIAIVARLTEIGLMKLSQALGAEDVVIGNDSLSEIISNPFGWSIALVVVLISAVTFSYADIANGYIKNIAGQVSNKGNTALSKFVVLSVHNFIFMFCAMIGRVIIGVITGGIHMDWVEVPLAIGTFGVKWLLLVSLSSILLFVSTGLKNKTLASVVGVILGSGSLMLLHLMIDSTVERFIHVDISRYDPSMLIQESNMIFGNAILVALVVIAIFLPLTVVIFNKTDVK